MRIAHHRDIKYGPSYVQLTETKPGRGRTVNALTHQTNGQQAHVFCTYVRGHTPPYQKMAAFCNRHSKRETGRTS